MECLLDGRVARRVRGCLHTVHFCNVAPSSDSSSLACDLPVPKLDRDGTKDVLQEVDENKWVDQFPTVASR